MPQRFVIHKHTQEGQTHWDLMIEEGDKLKTWRLENPPEKLAKDFDKLSPGKTRATPIFDHDKKFLTYQGPVNNGKGTVEIVDEGICTIDSCDEHNLKIKFEGKILRGNYQFTHINSVWLICSK
jgi:hypothetical protein